uniref:Adenine-specific methyltransferase n=1 Tax=Siphoviridae sp. ctFn287 TaxID=2826215 RepID=A0A8S5LV87_9CAUD|nr:MAG TPA: adenine-specific methyltransferase [Siphoviridae sp. ctFn287]
MPYTDGVARVGKALAKRKDYSNTGDWDSQRLTKEYFDLMFKVSKNQIIFGGNYYTDYLPPTKSWIVWDKRCDNNMRNDFADCEMAWCSKGVARVFHYLYNGMLQGDMSNKDERFHPTQKPSQLIKQILTFYTKEGDLIFDPFAGSCVVEVCCHKLQRRFIGCEINKEYFDKGSKWLDKEMAQMSIFDYLKTDK